MSTRRRIAAAVAVMLFGVFACSFVSGNAGLVRHLASGMWSIDPRVALVGLVCSCLAITNRGGLNRSAHRAVGLDAGLGAMTQTAAVGFAAQKLVKSGGAVGLAVFVRHGRRRGHAAGPVAAACVLAAAASFAALGVLLGMVVGVLAVAGRLTGWWIAAAVGFSIYAVVVAVVAGLLLRSRDAAVAVWRFGQRLRLRMRRRPQVAAAESSLPVELFDAIDAARRQPDALRQLLLHAVLSKILGASMLAAAVSAVGLEVDAPGALAIYATALAASMVSIVPGGIGTVEASTMALLVGAGATAAAAALAVALFRLFDLWLPLATGAVFARRDVGEPEPIPTAVNTSSPAVGTLTANAVPAAA